MCQELLDAEVMVRGWLAVVIKYAEHTDNCEVTRKYSVSQGTEGKNNQN
jgi:hypothetical protein